MQGVDIYNPYPGDIIRDKETNTDYVVYSVGAIASGYLLYQAVSLHDQSLKDWRTDMYAPIKLIKSNVNNLPPFVVAQHAHQTFNQVNNFKSMGINAGNIYENTAEAAFFRDMLLISSSIDKYDEKLMSLVSSVVGLTNRSWSAEDFYDALYHEATSAGVSEEVLADFAEQASLNSRLFSPNRTVSSSADQEVLGALINPGVTRNWNNTPLRQLDSILDNVKKTRQGGTSVTSPLQASRRAWGAFRSIIGGRKIYNNTPFTSSEDATRQLVNDLLSYGADTKGLSIDFQRTPEVLKIIKEITKKVQNGENIPTEIFESIQRLPGAKKFFDLLERTDNAQIRAKQRAARQSQVYKTKSLLNPMAISKSQMEKLAETSPVVGFRTRDYLEKYIQGRKHVKFQGELFSLASSESIDDLVRKGGNIFTSNEILLVSTSNAVKHMDRDNRDVVDLDALLEQSAELKRSLDPTDPKLTTLDSQLVKSQASAISFRNVVNQDQQRTLTDGIVWLKQNMASTENSDFLPKAPLDTTRVFMSRNSKNRISYNTSLVDLINQHEGMYYYVDLKSEQYKQLVEQNTASSFFGDAKQVFPSQTGYTSGVEKLIEHLEKGAETAKQIPRSNLTLGFADEVYGQEIFTQGFLQGKLALAPLRDGNYQVISSSIGNIPNQYKLAEQLYNGGINTKVGILDIETAPRLHDLPHSPRRTGDNHAIWDITNVSFMDIKESTSDLLQEVEDIHKQVVEGTLTKEKAHLQLAKLAQKHNKPFLFKGFDTNQSEEYYKQVKTWITSLVDQMDSYHVVVTQTDADYKFLIDQLHNIPSTIISDSERSKLTRRIISIKQNKGLDATLITGLHHKSVNQSAIAQKTLNQAEIHISTMDNVQLMRIIEHLQQPFNKDKSRFLKDSSDMLMTELQFPKGVWISLAGTRDPVFGSSTVQVLNMTQLLNNEVELTYRNRNGAVSTVRMNTNMLAGILKRSVISTSTGDPDFKAVTQSLTKDIVDQRQKLITDRAGRMWRDLNALNSTEGFGYSNVNPQALTNKSKSIHKMRVKRYVEKLKSDASFMSDIDGIVQNLSPGERTATNIERGVYNYLKDLNIKSVNGVESLIEDSDMIQDIEKILTVDENPMEYAETFLDHVSEEFSHQFVHDLEADSNTALFNSLGDNLDWYSKLLYDPNYEGVLEALHFKSIKDGTKRMVKDSGFKYSLKMKGIDRLTRSKELDIESGISFASTIQDFILNANLYANNGDKPALDFFGGQPGVLLNEALVEELKFDNPEYQRDMGYSVFSKLHPVLDQDYHRMVNQRVQKDLETLGVDDSSFILEPFKQLVDQHNGADKSEVELLLENMRNNLTRLRNNTKSNEVTLQQVDLVMQQTLLDWSNKESNGYTPQMKMQLLQTEREALDSLDNLSGDYLKGQFGRVADILKNQVISNKDPLLKGIFDGEEDQEIAVSDAIKALMDQKRDDSGKLLVPREDAEEGIMALLNRSAPGAKKYSVHTATPHPHVPNVGNAVTHATMGRATSASTSTASANTSVMGSAMRGAMNDYLTVNLTSGKLLTTVAAVAAFLAVKKANITSQYSAGMESDDRGNLNDLNAVSEVPGGRGGIPFSGQAGAFTMDVSIKAFVKDQKEKDKIVQTVYDSVNNSTSFRRSSLNVRTLPDNNLKKRLESYYAPAFS